MSQSFCLQSPGSDGHDRSQPRGSEVHGFPGTAPAPLSRAVLEFNATLVSRQDLSNTLAIFRVRPDEVPSPGASWFEPGQYTAFGLRDGDGRNDRALLRPYSMASPPEERRWLELYVRRVGTAPGSDTFTWRLWDLPPGGRLHVRGSYAGWLTLRHTIRDDDTRWRLFVASGTGLGPFVSIVRSQARRCSPLLPRMVVLHGASFAHELGYRAELGSTLGERYFPSVSRPTPPLREDEAGRVETFFDQGRVEVLEEVLGLRPGGLTPETAVIFVCGLRGTIAETCRRLLRRGFVPANHRLRRWLGVADRVPASLFFEQYDTAPIFPAEQLEALRQVLVARSR